MQVDLGARVLPTGFTYLPRQEGGNGRVGNYRFALSVEPGNAALVARMQEVDRRRAANQPTVPSRLADELATNPFLRPDSPEIQQTVGLPGAPLAEVFGATRARKDTFRG